ncbi:MAG: helix-turn-helix transcriptional regulator [Pseudomonadota bacterium]
MEVYEKIKFIRHFRNWSQEKMADKLQMTPNGYAKIEQGKVDRVELAQLVGLNLKKNFNSCSYNI